MNEVAPEGQVFVCGACGKRSRDRYGFRSVDRGYDESCMLNAVLCHEERQLRVNDRGEMSWVWVAVQNGEGESDAQGR